MDQHRPPAGPRPRTENADLLTTLGQPDRLPRPVRAATRVWALEGPSPLLSRIGQRLWDVVRGRRNLRDLFAVADRKPPAVIDLDTEYRQWLSNRAMTPDREARIRAEIARFTYAPLISIIMSVSEATGSPPPQALDSLQAQLYERWQLCVVHDPSRAPHWSSLLAARAAADSRIHVIRHEGSGGGAAEYNDALAIADGEFVTLLQPQDVLAPHALSEVVGRLNADPALDVIYSDEDMLDEQGARRAPFFKPDWSPDLLLSTDYICRLGILRRSLVISVGGFRPRCEGNEAYDLVLRVTERTSRIDHVPDVLYSRSVAPAPSAMAAEPVAADVIRQTLERRGTPGEVRMVLPGRYTRRLLVPSLPRVSIIIPTRDHPVLLRKCVESIQRVTAYPEIEFIVVDNGTRDWRALAYLRRLARKHTVLRDSEAFNFSRVCNGAAARAEGPLLLFLNNDIEAVHPDWLTAMVEQVMRPEVGAVGCRLVFPDGWTQHAGVVVGLGGTAGHPFHGMAPQTPGYMGLDRVIRNCSAVTGACLMMRRALFDEVGGFDKGYQVVLGDVDMCLRLRERGHLIVYTPEATLIHHESATRRQRNPVEDIQRFRAKWSNLLERGDPYYHPQFSLAAQGYALRL